MCAVIGAASRQTADDALTPKQRPDEAMLQQCESWRHFTARKINRTVGRFGRFWEQDAFDHLVCSPEECERLRRYIADNPAAAGLSPGEYLYYTEDRRGRVVLVTLRRDVSPLTAEREEYEGAWGPHGGA